MTTKGLSRWFLIASLAGIFTLLTMWTIPVHAQIHTPQAEPKCISCHEDLYFLHDTGKLFCLNEETPMNCVGCHDGDPTAISKEAAHADRAAHPIINENASKCSECHPEQSSERVEIFAREAGISLVMVSQPYKPAYIAAEAQSIPVTGNAPNSKWIPAVAGVLFIVIAGLVLVVYILFRVYRSRNVKP
jgi:hypothetical protein